MAKVVKCEVLAFLLTDRARLLMNKAKEVADRCEDKFVGLEHIAAAMLQVDGVAKSVFEERNIVESDFLLP